MHVKNSLGAPSSIISISYRDTFHHGSLTSLAMNTNGIDVVFLTIIMKPADRSHRLNMPAIFRISDIFRIFDIYGGEKKYYNVLQ